MDQCPCGSARAYADCCLPLIKGDRTAETAEQLMRSRYSSYVMKEMKFLFTSLHPDHRKDFDEDASRAWANSAEWHGITILRTIGGGAGDNTGQVEFAVTYSENGIRQEHHELSSFKKENGSWYFTTGKTIATPVTRAAPKTGRNDPCPCGSGRKFKKCCGP